MNNALCIAAFLLLMFLGLPTGARAFDGQEHRDISNLALRVALAEVTKTEDVYTEAALLLVPPEEMTYGGLVALADHVRDVSEVLTDDRRAIGLPRSLAEVDPERLKDFSADLFARAEALHTNDTHFQAVALRTYWSVHERAKVAAAEGNLIGALILEAYANHFLQDFYAPGHVVTPRTELVDFASTASHDKGNRKGLDFVFDPDADLNALVDRIERVAKKTECVEGELHLAQVAGNPASANLAASRLDLRESDFTSLRTAIQTGRLRFYGDSRLDKNHAQALFIVAATVASIDEVLSSHANQQVEPSLDQLCFFSGVANLGADQVVCGEIADGRNPLRQRVLRNGRAVSVRVAKTRLGEFDVVSPSLFTTFAPLDLLLVSAFGAWAPKGRIENGSGGVGIETLLTAFQPGAFTQGARASGWKENGLTSFLGRMPPAVAFGISGRWDDRLSATRLGVRYIYPLPRIDVQLYGGSGLEWIQAPGISAWKSYGGLGVEIGYGHLYFHLGAEQNWEWTAEDQLQPILAFRSGVTLMIPGSLYQKSRKQ